MEGVFFPERWLWACLLVVFLAGILRASRIRPVPWPLVVSGLLHIGPGFLVVLLAFVLLPVALLAGLS
jgi:ABC-type thiamin/hydroxymethylpyrimidine transport system permease subunit